MTNDYSDKRSSILRSVCGIAILWLAMLALPIFAQGVPASISYQGKLTNSSGVAVPDGSYLLTVKFYSVETLGAPTWSSAAISVTTIGGIFTARIDGIPSTAMPGPDVWLETVVGAETLAPRVKLASVPFALRAGGLSLATGASAGYVLTSDASGNGTWQAIAGGPGGIGGAGTANYIPWWTGTGTLGNSVIYQDASNNIGIGTTTPAAALDVLTSTSAGMRSESTAFGGTGITGVANNKTRWGAFPVGVSGISTTGIGVQATGSLYGLSATSDSIGVDATGTAYGVRAQASGSGIGVLGSGSSGDGVHGFSSGAAGVSGDGGTYGVVGYSTAGTGAWGISDSGTGGQFTSTQGNAIDASGGYWGANVTGAFGGINASSPGGNGITASGGDWGAIITGGTGGGIRVTAYDGAWGAYIIGGWQGGIITSGDDTGVDAAGNLYGVRGGTTTGTGVAGRSDSGYGGYFYSRIGKAGYFDGNVTIVGSLTVSGVKNFQIDHPLDPANKYLVHSCIESPDMMNIYNGNVTTDARGDATVSLPGYFEALNRDFRYQLTVIGQFAQAIVATKVKDNKFTIKTDKPDVEVSWQVTGIRQDAYAKAHPMVVEEDKPASERGTYLYPEPYGQPASKG